MTDRQYGMISEEERLRDDLPRSVPGQIFLIKQNTHQFKDSQCGVSLRNELKQNCSTVPDSALTSLSCIATSDNC